LSTVLTKYLPPAFSTVTGTGISMITRKNAYVLAHLGVMATTCNAKANLQDQGQGLISQ